MILIDSQKLETLLIRSLSKKGSATALTLKGELEKQNLQFSLPGVYKELNKLLITGVVVKHGQRFRLSLPWIFNLLEFADQMYERQLQTSDDESLLPDPGTSMTLKFSSLARLDDFWINLLILMSQKSVSKHVYQWIPHPWFHLIQSKKAFFFQEALKSSGSVIKSIIGGRTKLDLASKKLNTPPSYVYFYAEGPFEGEHSRYLSVTENYLLEIKLDQVATETLDSIYHSYKDFESVPLSVASQLLMLKTKATVKIHHNEKIAEKYLKKFRNYFGD
jgi:hypothetical protein